VTAPGAVAGWAALAERHGRLGLEHALADAIDIAERGFGVTPVIAGYWANAAAELAQFEEARAVFLPAPRVGQIVRLPELAATLRGIASGGADGFYRGPVADAICAVTPLTLDDLAVPHAEWVEPLRMHYRGVEVCEIPPNGQGVAALQALGILEGLDHTGGRVLDRVHLESEAMKLAFADAERHVHDGPLPPRYLDEEYLASRRALIDPARAGAPSAGALGRSGTVYLCAVDEQRNACSLIQSVYHGFGSMVVAPGTGVVLQNRGHCFTLEQGHPNRLAPGKRPYHTIIPGLLLREGDLLGPFGLMGGHMQPQGHLQVVSHMTDRGLDPQAALDEPRWRLDRDAREGWSLALEEPLHGLAPALARRGHRVLCDPNPAAFGGGQAVLVRDDVLIGGSESRKDGVALGY
jgi:gamma-glutamyltranspeptidase/glutathione hydrolase